MNRTIVEAKTEVDSFITNLTTKLGIKSLKDKFGTPQLEEIIKEDK